MNALEAYERTKARQDEEGNRKLRIARIVADALYVGAGLDGLVLSVEEKPKMNVNGEYIGRRVLTVTIESLPCDRDKAPECWF